MQYQKEVEMDQVLMKKNFLIIMLIVMPHFQVKKKNILQMYII